MSALTARESARYALRLFGSLLATTLLSGLFVGGGLALAYVLEPDVLPGGAAPDSYGVLAAAAGLVVLGALVFLTGIVYVLFTAMVDAVRVGTGRREATPTADDSEADTSDVDTSDEEAASEAEERTPGPGETAVPDPAETEPVDAADAADEESSTAEADPLGPDSTESPDEGGTDPFASAAESESDPFDPTDPMDDPRSASSSPFDEPEDDAEEWTSKADSAEDRRRAGPGEDEEAWREEIEAKLDAEERED